MPGVEGASLTIFSRGKSLSSLHLPMFSIVSFASPAVSVPPPREPRPRRHREQFGVFFWTSDKKIQGTGEAAEHDNEPDSGVPMSPLSFVKLAVCPIAAMLWLSAACAPVHAYLATRCAPTNAGLHPAAVTAINSLSKSTAVTTAERAL